MFNKKLNFKLICCLLFLILLSNLYLLAVTNISYYSNSYTQDMYNDFLLIPDSLTTIDYINEDFSKGIFENKFVYKTKSYAQRSKNRIFNS